MTEQYNESVAAHYAAYRPPLHQMILQQAGLGTKLFPVGLDVGCGTGRSAVALTDFCSRVDAIDPSPSMIKAAVPHHSITYLTGSAEQMPIADQSVDIVTFAGSLSYTQPSLTVRELCRVCRPDSLIMPYDFEVILDDLLKRFGITETANEPPYNHAANFSDFPVLKELLVERDRIEFTVSPTNTAHLLLADHTRHAAFVDHYNTTLPLEALIDEIDASDGTMTVCADIYFSLYQPVPT